MRTVVYLVFWLILILGTICLTSCGKGVSIAYKASPSALPSDDTMRATDEEMRLLLDISSKMGQTLYYVSVLQSAGVDPEVLQAVSAAIEKAHAIAEREATKIQ